MMTFGRLYLLSPPPSGKEHTFSIYHFHFHLITTVQYQPYQYRRILYGHVVGMVRCDWPPAPSIIIKHFFNYYYGMFLKHCLGRQHSALDSSYCRITCQTDSIGSQRLNVTCHSYATMLIKIIILTKTLKLLFKSGSIYYI